MSLWLMRFLLVQYLLLGIVSVYEQRFPQACYWTGAVLITVGLLAMR